MFPLTSFVVVLQQKAEDQWSDEEKKLVAEYERKVKELEEEREKYRKVKHGRSWNVCHVRDA